MNKKKLLRKILYYFIGFIAIIIVFDQVIMPLYTKHGNEYELPDVTEKPLSEAIDLLESEGFDPVILDSVFDANYLPDVVIRQNPLPYTMVKKGRRIYLVVSIGERPIYMPNLIGTTFTDAEFRLKDQTLNLNNTIYEFSEFYPNGVVINQSVPAGDKVERNQNVNITVSLGPPPSSKEVPNLVGKSMNYVRKELETLEIPLGKVKYQYRPNLVPETVVAQSVSAGTPAVKADSIIVTISTDKPIEKPEENKQGESTNE
jgi:serine/threonine-protein kinase